ncbi:hypothetical protein A2U01_0069302, partial [Trifolium medium]|nr:hypothetical protein [Trifolium medium]
SGKNGFWAWPGPNSRAEPQIWPCVAKRRLASLSEGFEYSLSEGQVAERGSSLFVAWKWKFVCLISLGLAVAR